VAGGAADAGACVAAGACRSRGEPRLWPVPLRCEYFITVGLEKTRGCRHCGARRTEAGRRMPDSGERYAACTGLCMLQPQGVERPLEKAGTRIQPDVYATPQGIAKASRPKGREAGVPIDYLL